MTKLCRVNNTLRSYRTYMGKCQLPRVESEALLEENHKWTFEIRLRSPNYLWFDDEFRGPVRKPGKPTGGLHLGLWKASTTHLGTISLILPPFDTVIYMITPASGTPQHPINLLTAPWTFRNQPNDLCLILIYTCICVLPASSS